MIKYFFLAIILILGALSIDYYCASHRELNCSGRISVLSAQNRFNGIIFYDFTQNNKLGNVQIIGSLLNNEKQMQFNRTIYFSYTKSGSHYLLETHKIAKSSSDNSDDAIAEHVLPSFYIYNNQKLSLRVEKYHNGVLLYTSNVPSLFCTFK